MELTPETLTPLIASVSDKYFTAHLNQKKKNDEDQLEAINKTLKQWSDQITNEIRKYSRVSSAERAALAIEDAFVDVKDRQTKLIDEIKDTHKKQLDILKNAIAEERYEANQSQQIFEDTLYTKYEHMVTGLQEKIKLEQELSMKRALNELERSARMECETMKQSYELQQVAETAMSNKLKSIVSDMRKSWEEEELLRAKQLGDRLRNHYSTVLEHMEAQLQMALKLQQDADEQWMVDVEIRNKQQIHMMHVFEEKCRLVYETRLKQYTDRTELQLSQYEEQLLEAGSQLSNEKSLFESIQRKLKLDYEQWKIEYIAKQNDKMTATITEMEIKYDSEIKTLMNELELLRNKISILQSQLTQTEKLIVEREITVQQQQQQAIEMQQLKDQQIINNKNATINEYDDSILLTVESEETLTRKREFQDQLVSHWEELNTPITARVTALVSLLDAAPLTPRLVKQYDVITSQLTAQLPIVHLARRKQYVDFKLKMNNNSNHSSVSKEVQIELQRESNQLQLDIDTSIRVYEEQYKVKFVMPPAGYTTYTGASLTGGSGNNTTTNTNNSNTATVNSGGGIHTGVAGSHRYLHNMNSTSGVSTGNNIAPNSNSEIDDTRSTNASTNNNNNHGSNTNTTPSSLNKSNLYFKKSK